MFDIINLLGLSFLYDINILSQCFEPLVAQIQLLQCVNFGFRKHCVSQFVAVTAYKQ